MKENTEALLVASKECGLEVNADKTKYMVIARDKNAERNRRIKIDNITVERVEQFKYLATALKNENSIQVEIKSRLKSGNACYHSVQSLLSSSLLTRNVKIKTCRTINLPIVLYGCETWLFILGEEHRLKLFVNRVLRRIFGTKRDEVT